VKRAPVTLAATLAAVALVGCGGCSGDKPLYTYPDIVKASFMSNCTQAAAGGRTDLQEKAQNTCKCALVYLADRVPATRLAELNQANPPQDLANTAQAAINTCAK